MKQPLPPFLLRHVVGKLDGISANSQHSLIKIPAKPEQAKLFSAMERRVNNPTKERVESKLAIRKKIGY